MRTKFIQKSLNIAKSAKLFEPWYASLDTSLDDWIASVLAVPNGTHRMLRYDPFNFEQWLSSGAARLDACIVRRRDAQDLLDKAVRQEAELALFVRIREQDDSQEAASNNGAALAATKTGAKEARSAYNTEDTALCKGGAATAKALYAVTEDQLQRETTRMSALAMKATALREHNDLLVLRSKELGGASNYHERYLRVVRALLDDVQEVYAKLVAVQVGLKLVHGLALSIAAPFKAKPAPDLINITSLEATNYLDYLVKWTRDAARELELLRAREVVIDLTIPYFDTAYPDGSTATKKPPNIAAVVGAKDLGSGSIALNVSSGWFNGMSGVRVLGVGVSVNTAIPADDNIRNRFQYRVLVKAPARPEQLPLPPNWNPELSAWAPRSLLVGNASLLPIGGEPKLSICPGMSNANPIGRWDLQLIRGVVSNNTGGPLPTRTEVADVKLHVRIAAILG